MSLSEALRAVVRTFRHRPGDLLPLYVLGAAIPAIVRVVPFLAAVVAYAYAAQTGRLDAVLENLAAQEMEPPPDPEQEPEAFEAWIESQVVLVEPLLTPTMALLIFGAIALSVVLAVVGYAVVAAGQIATCHARLQAERGLTAGFAGVRRYWLTFLGLFVLEFILWIASGIVIGIIAFLVVTLTAATGTAILGVLVAVALVLLWLAFGAVIRALFAFAPVAVVVDDVGVAASLSNTVSFIRAKPIDAIAYYVLSVGTLVALSTLTGVLALIDIFVLGSLVSALIVLPALDLLKTTFFGRYRGTITPPPAPERSIRSQFVAGIRRGTREMGSFVRETPVTHAAVVALAVGTFWIGWMAAEPFVGQIPTSIEARLEGHVPPTATIEFFANNWLVALTTAFSGLAFAIPALASIAFNGVVLGMYSRLEVDIVELIAFVVPHGIFEIPAIIVAGSLGVWLGIVTTKTLFGRQTGAEFADALERAFWVSVGIGLLLAIAAVIEGFVSPYYFRVFL